MSGFLQGVKNPTTVVMFSDPSHRIPSFSGPLAVGNFFLTWFKAHYVICACINVPVTYTKRFHDIQTCPCFSNRVITRSKSIAVELL